MLEDSLPPKSAPNHARQCHGLRQHSFASTPRSATDFELSSAFASGLHLAAIPEHLGGKRIDAVSLQEEFMSLATKDLSAAILITQRHSAMSWIANSPPTCHRELLLEKGCHAFVATQAISTITPAAKTVRSPLQIELHSKDIQLSGMVPWVSGVSYSEQLIVGGHDKQGRSVVCHVPLQEPRLCVQHLDGLHALQNSDSAKIDFNNVILSREHVLFQPSEELFTDKNGNSLRIYPHYQTSSLALGHSARILKVILEQKTLSSLDETVDKLLYDQQRLTKQLKSIIGSSDPIHEKCRQHTEVRALSNAHVIRAAESLFSITSGEGFLLDSQSSQLHRESHFFLVWACTPEVRRRTLELLHTRNK